MSFRLVDLIRKRKYGNAVRRAVLTMLAQHADDDGRNVYPSVNTLATEAGCHPTTVRLHIKALLADGLLHEVGPRACRHGHVNEYRLDVDALRALPATKPSRSPTPREAQPLAQLIPSLPPTARAEGTDPSRSASQLFHRPSSSSSAEQVDSWMKSIFEAAGPALADPDKDPRIALDLRGRIPAWQAAHWSLDDDVLPVVRARTANPRKTPMFTFQFLEPQIAEHSALRAKPAPRAESRARHHVPNAAGLSRSRYTGDDPEVRKPGQVSPPAERSAQQKLQHRRLELQFLREGRPFAEQRGPAPAGGWEKWLEDQIAEIKLQQERG